MVGENDNDEDDENDPVLLGRNDSDQTNETSTTPAVQSTKLPIKPRPKSLKKKTTRGIECYEGSCLLNCQGEKERKM